MSLKSGTILKKSTNPLDKQLPKNPKYEHIQSTLDTGITMKKQLDSHDEDPEHPTTGERFKRIKAGSLTRLVFEEDEIYDPTLVALSSYPETIYDNDMGPLRSPSSVKEIRERQLSGKETANLLSSQWGDESDQKESKSSSSSSSSTSSPISTSSTSSFLLLDVRSDDLYNQCHIRYARHYPIRLLSHSINPFTKEVNEYKNKEDKKIIVYSGEEKESIRVANTFYERGVDNIYILNGGLKKICQKYPEVLVFDENHIQPYPTDKRLMENRNLSSTTSSISSYSSSLTSRSSLVSSASTAKYLQDRLGPGAAGKKYAPSSVNSKSGTGSSKGDPRSNSPSFPLRSSSQPTPSDPGRMKRNSPSSMKRP